MRTPHSRLFLSPQERGSFLVTAKRTNNALSSSFIENPKNVGYTYDLSEPYDMKLTKDLLKLRVGDYCAYEDVMDLRMVERDT